MLVEMRQTVRVGGEMRGNPVEDDAEPRRVRAIDEACESFGLTKAPRPVVPAPRAAVLGFLGAAAPAV